MSKVIAIANQKGGVGKTTTCINLGIGLQRAGKKVCLIDLDPQGNATQSLGFKSEQMEDTITSIFNMIIDRKEDFPDDYGILEHREGVHIVPANIELAFMEMKLLSVYIGREKILEKYIEKIRDKYDYILIDCKPSLDILTLNALTVANSILIPVQAQFFSVKGLEQLLNTINQVIVGGLNTGLCIDGILFTLVNDRTNSFKEITKIIEGAYGSHIKIFDNYIPRSVRAEEAPASGTSIYEFDPAGTVAAAYQKFTQEYLGL